jgi:DNA-binding transcriptional LysR family regulator
VSGDFKSCRDAVTETALSIKAAKMQPTAWDDLRYVLALARFATIAEAARHLSVDEATVRRRIARIERQLGARLFDRARGRLAPTEAGRAAAERAERVEQEVEGLIAAATGAGRVAAGRVRVTAVPVIVNRLLLPALPLLVEANPGLTVDLIAEPRDLSPVKREVDIAVRLARPVQELRAIARRIADLVYAVYGAPGRDSDSLPWITYEDLMADLPQARWIADCITAGDAEAPVRVNDAEGIVSALEQGIGKSLLPSVIGDAVKGLIRLEDAAPPLVREIWLLTHPELRGLPRIQAVVDWLDFVLRPRAGSPRFSSESRDLDGATE